MERKEKMNLENICHWQRQHIIFCFRCLSRDMDMRWCRRRKN